MKPKTALSTSFRCLYRTPNGRQCRLLASDAHSGLCAKHRAEQKIVESSDHYSHLSRNYHDFQTAQGINHSLHSLYELLAQNRISPRRAAVLSYISSLLLRTLPQIDADRAAGISWPPNTQNMSDPEPDSVDLDAPSCSDVGATLGSPVFDTDEAPDSEADTDSGENEEAITVSSSDPGNTWDPSNPEPDPRKKPS